MNNCTLCPRSCGVNRTTGQRGRCHETDTVRIARASLHLWEEPCISGTQGSGTVFFTGCPLGCVFCQNHNIADGTNGVPITVGQLTDVYFKLQDMGAHNINLVTPTHFVPQIAASLEQAKSRGLSIPVVYNTGTYETVTTLRILDGLVDVWLPDLKYVSSELSMRYSFAPDYFEVAALALEEMVRQTRSRTFPVGQARQPSSGNLHNHLCRFTQERLMTDGIIVRHLILPGCTEDSKAVLKYLYSTYGDNIYLSIMNQFTPLPHLAALSSGAYAELNRTVTQEEYDEVINFALDLGITNAFVQEGGTASESFIPDFEAFNLKAFLS